MSYADDRRTFFAGSALFMSQFGVTRLRVLRLAQSRIESRGFNKELLSGRNHVLSQLLLALVNGMCGDEVSAKGFLGVPSSLVVRQYCKHGLAA